jgi:hypothetical protein
LEIGLLIGARPCGHRFPNYLKRGEFMWVILKKGFSGVLPGDEGRCLLSGQRYDLPEQIVKALRKKLSKKNVIETCALWDEHKDMAAAEQEQKTIDANAAIAKAEKLLARCDELLQTIEAADTEYERLLPEAKNAEEQARKAAKAAGIQWPEKKEDAGEPE